MTMVERLRPTTYGMGKVVQVVCRSAFTGVGGVGGVLHPLHSLHIGTARKAEVWS
jgi:hypothetical protein